MSYLIDTNIASELRRRHRGNPGVMRWAGTIHLSELHTSVLVIGEIRRGIERKRRSDPERALVLDRWLASVCADLAGKILPVDERIAELWGHLGASVSIPSIDGLIAATAIVHGLTLVTRNVKDMSATGARLLNPFT